MKLFKKLVKKTQNQMKDYVAKALKAYYKEIVVADGFVYAKGKEEVLLTAHMDTVFKTPVKNIVIENVNGKTKISSPQGIGGDDRCGIWIIFKILNSTKYRPSILFCEDEEIGGVGSSKFVKTKYCEDLLNLKYFIELDRKGNNDSVFYDCGNEEFEEYINKITNNETNWGSFSDIGHLSPATDIASVNLSTGTYQSHKVDEFVIYEEMCEAVEKVKWLLADLVNVDKFDYQEINKFISRSSYNSPTYWGAYYGGYDDYSIFDESDSVYVEIYYKDDKEKDCYYSAEGDDAEKCLLDFFIDNPKVCYADIVDMQVW